MSASAAHLRQAARPVRRLHWACAGLLWALCATAGAQEATTQAGVARAAIPADRVLPAPAFDRPLRLMSLVKGAEAVADIETLVERPFGDLMAVLADPQRWCAVLVLHINNTGCRVEPAAAGQPATIALSIARSVDPPSAQADTLVFNWQPMHAGPQRMMVRLEAAKGYLGTFDHALVLDAAPAGAQRTALRLSYSYRHSVLADWGLMVWLATVGRGKVGFSTEGGPADGGPPRLVGGVRGLLERNLMLYLIAIEAAARVPAVPDAAAYRQRLLHYFEGAERYPRQLRELALPAYLALKRPLVGVGTLGAGQP